MENWITDFMEQYGYFGIFLMIALENIFPPIPSEVVLPFGGFMTTNSDLTIPGVILAATAGSVVGAVILFWIGLQLDVERLEKIIDKWGHILRVKKKDVHRADAWFDKYGIWTVFFCRMVPLLRSLISIPAGMSNMNFVKFLLFTTAGTLIWNIALVLLGASLGEAWPKINDYVGVYSSVIYAVLGVAAVAVIIWFVRKRMTNRTS
ncbi:MULTISPECIES: DedA family protein [Metabacillus]|uniref:DedA family protein n=1 Tax=Metabacillus TaxID=2675233 RepID=UPI0019396171|nr:MULTISPECIES: DedA family protein [Metabacillus]